MTIRMFPEALQSPGKLTFERSQFPKKLRKGTYGRKVASWGALQNSQGTATLITPTAYPPFQDNAVKVLRLDQHASTSFGQQNPVDGSQAYMPKGTNPGFSVGVWVSNPNNRTLNFRVVLYNVAANRTVTWNCACDPTGLNNWVFLTMSPSQQNVSGWVHGTDAVGYVRIEQQDNGTEGAWVAGEYMLFGNLYVDCATKPKFLITFDDGIRDQRHPNVTNRVSGTAFVSSTAANVLTTAVAHSLIVGEPIVFSETPPTSLTAGIVYWVKTTPTTTTFRLATDEALTIDATTTGFAGTARYQYGGCQDRSGQQIVENYGFRGNLFIVPKWLETSGRYGYGAATFLSRQDVIDMYNEGWSVGSHSNTHPSNGDNAGLRLLGPYGYFLSNTVDNLSAKYVAAWSLGATNRRRATSSTQASPSVVTFENAHKFLVNQPIVFTDVAPTGFQVGVTYYVASVPTTTTATFATDQGTLTSLVNNPAGGAWSGTSNYRWPGSSNDDTAIYTDIVDGANGVLALGIPTGYKYFALPQGGADEFVRSACLRAGLSWVRGISGYNNAHTIPLGKPTGGGLSQINDRPGGWMSQVDAVQTDGTVTLAQIDQYVNDTITQGACGCNYHHGTSTTGGVNLERLCKTLRTKVDANLIEVQTLDELARDIGI